MKYDSGIFMSMGDKIAQERKRRRMKQTDLITALQLKGVKIGRNRLSAIEGGLKTREQIDIDFLLAICEIFDWDLGYLFEEYKEKKRETHDFCEYSGLSEKTIDTIASLRTPLDGVSGTDIINDLFEQDAIQYFVNYIHLAYTTISETSANEETAWDIPDGRLRFDTDTGGNRVVVLWPKETARTFMRDASEIAKTMIETAIRSRWDKRIMEGENKNG